MNPQNATKDELELRKSVVDKAAEAVFAEQDRRLDYLVGTMIELPRAALKAGEIADAAAFFSFGTNDLTPTTLGVSRDDAGRRSAERRVGKECVCTCRSRGSPCQSNKKR